MSKNYIYEKATEQFIKQLEQCLKTGEKLPWQKPWFVPSLKTKKIRVPMNDSTCAYNAHSGKVYSLTNQFLLGRTGAWATINQINELGGRVKKGEKSSIVVFWKQELKTKTNEDGEKETTSYWMLKYYQVFHISTQTENVDTDKIHKPIDIIETVSDEEAVESTWNPVEKAEEIVNDYVDKYKIKLENDRISDRACYRPSSDSITVPMKEQFKNRNEYYSTLFHEMTHSTGHSSRLDRLGKEEGCLFGGKGYAKEELVAEIGANTLRNILGMEDTSADKNSVAYIQSWLERLKNDNTLILSAGGKAEKAIEMILNS